ELKFGPTGMNHSARRCSPPSGSKTGGRFGERTGIRYTEEGTGATRVLGFRARFSPGPSPERSRSLPSTFKSAHKAAPVGASHPVRGFAGSPRASVNPVTMPYRDSAHGEEGRATGKRNTELPGFRTPTYRGFMHRVTGNPNTKTTPLTG